jgi:GTP-binding protein Era
MQDEGPSPTARFGCAALLGPPNAGKSTLMNRLLGEKIAIVTPKPQTTRNTITGILSRRDLQVVFLDTPGLHQRTGRMNRMLLESAWSALAQADCLVVLMDAVKMVKNPPRLDQDFDILRQRALETGLPLIAAVNKVDKVKDKSMLLPVLKAAGDFFPDAEIVPVSALAGEGLDTLLDAIAERLPPGDPAFPDDQLSTVPLRFMASEIIREKLFMALRQELPYSTAVVIDDFDEDLDADIVRIEATIVTARDNHKGMIIGKRGAMLKTIGQQAREEIEELMAMRCGLKLWVKVRPDWMEDLNFLQTLGLGE